MPRKTGRLSRRQLLRSAVALSAGVAGLGSRAGVRAAGTKTIRYWSFLNPKDSNPRSRAQNQLIAEFTRRTGIEVNVEVVPWQEIDQKLILATQAGRGPDISRAQSELLAEHLASRSILPLDEFAEGMSKKDRDDFIMPWDATVFDGKKMSFYIEHRVQLLLHRKDLLARAGMNVPGTWAEFTAAARSITNPPLWGTIVPLSKKGRGTGFYQWFMPYVWGAGGEFFGENWKAGFRGPAGVAGLQLLADLVQKHKAMPVEAVSQDVESITQGLMAGNVGMATVGSHRLSFVLTSEAIRERIGIARIPSPKPGSSSPTHEAGWHFVMSKDAQNREAAWKFIDFMVSPEAQLTNVKLAGELPTRKSVLADPWFKTPEGANAAFALEYLIEKPRPARYPRHFAKLAESLAEAAQSVVLGRKQAGPALDEIAGKWENELRRG